jgi:hypothetical protein
MSPTVEMNFTSSDKPTTAPTVVNPWYVDLFKSREHETATSTETDDNVDGSTLSADDDEIGSSRRNLGVESLDSLYQTDMDADERASLLAALDSQPQLPDKQCEPWLPTIVPRQRTTSETWAGASPDPSSRAFSASATSRPRKLHQSFLQARTGLIDHTALRDSWLTSSLPINIEKYSNRHNKLEIKELPLIVPDMTSETSRFHRTVVNYGDKHPLDAARNDADDSYRPLRIKFVTDDLLDYPTRVASRSSDARESDMAAAVAKVEAITGDIIPSIADLYAGALSVVPSIDNIFPVSGSSRTDKCGEASFPQHHLNEGVPDADTLIYVTLDGAQCTDGITSYASVCSFDQHLRPFIGNLVICLDTIATTSRGEVTEKETLRLATSLTVQVGKILGLSTSLFQHYINPDTGKAWGATKKKVTCVDGKTLEVSVPNILLSTAESDDHGRASMSNPSFLITSPTVRQVVRNHFDCQTLSGARLDREPTSCFGESLDTRYHFDENMSKLGSSADMAYSLSPLTLALFEDSSWYKADFSTATVPLFGRGAGCGFVEGECVGKSYSVPDYSNDMYCGDIVESEITFDRKPSSCDYTHNHKADCEVLLQKDAKGGISVIKGNDGADHQCPMRTENIISCFDTSNDGEMKGEVYSANSRCFDTNTPSSVCLQSYCNAVDSKIDIVVDGKVHQCDYEGQEVNLGDYSIICPRLAVICPHLVCPSSCSGKGVCDYCRDVPTCICDNPFDQTPGCWGELLQNEWLMVEMAKQHL